MGRHVVALDIGNTNTRIGVVDVDACACLRRRSCATAGLGRRLPAALAWALRAARTKDVCVCSVVPRAARHVRAAARACGGRLVWVRHGAWCPLRVRYRRPDRLGADRLADALYCQRVHPGSNCVVIDAGTAVKVDYVRRGREFAGGAILAGVGAQLDALAHRCAALPALRGASGSRRLPGRSTAACMRAGARYAAAAAIDRIVAEYRRTLGVDMVLATGGGWRQVAPLVRTRCRYVRDLTLTGAGIAGALIRDRR